jgi:F-type H+-transporting ATPase subunit epsilon
MASMVLKLAIVTPEEQVVQEEVDEVVAPGVNGEIGLLSGHVPIVTALRPGVLTLIKSGRRSFYAVSTGFAEIEGDQVTVLTDSCEEAANVDVQRARRALTEAQDGLKTLSPDEPAYYEQRRRADRAQARLDAAQRRG